MGDLVSVIVPVYNREKYLFECIDSIINQTYKNLEIIFVDDGSTDNSLSILKHYERLDKRIIVMTQNNLGTCLAVKNALSISNGKYIFRVDSDDINYLDRCEKQLKFLLEKDYDVVGCYLKSFGNGSEISKKGMEVYVNRSIKDYHDQNKLIYEGCNIGGGYLFGKSDVLKKFSPFHKDYGLVDDVYLYILLHQNGCKIGILQEELYYYRVHNDNTSLDKNRKIVVEKHIEVIFRFLFREKILKYENVVIVKNDKDMRVIKNCFSEFYPNVKNVFYFDDDNVDEILKCDFKSDNTLFIIGHSFKTKLKDYVSERDFEVFENLFNLVDFCWWKNLGWWWL